MGDSSTPNLGVAPTGDPPAPINPQSSSTITSSASPAAATISLETVVFGSNPATTSVVTVTYGPVSTTSTISASPTPATILPPTANKADHRLGAGPVAGIAIACAIAGAIIAALVLIMLKKSRSKTPKGQHRKSPSFRQRSLRKEKSDYPNDGVSKSQHPSALAHRGLPPVSQVPVGIDAFLPQQSDDATIRQKYLLVFDQIDLHVDNYYFDGPLATELTPDQVAELSRFGTRTFSQTSLPLAGVLLNSRRKLTIIKHCLAFHAVSLVSPPASARSDCLLPSEIASMLTAVKAAEPRSASRNQASDQSLPTPLALSRWRQITAALRPDLFLLGTERPPPPDPTASKLRDAAVRFSHAFAPFCIPQYDDKRVEHLVEVLWSALRTTLWLLKEPATFRFEWGEAEGVEVDGGQVTALPSQSQDGSVATMKRRPVPPVRSSSGQGRRRRGESVEYETVPALLKTHDENGRKIEPMPQVIQERIMKRA